MSKKFIVCCVIILLCFLVGCTALPSSDTNEPSTNEEPSVTAETETKKEPLIPLLASDEAHDIFLYGVKPRGVILYVGDEGHYYDYEYDLSAEKLPKIGVGTFKYGSENDIAIVFPSEEGEELRIITNGKYAAEDVYTVDKSQIDFYMSRRVQYTYENETVIFSLDDASYIFDVSECFDKLVFDEVSYSENVTYEFSNRKIYVNVVPAVVSGDSENSYETAAAPISVRAELVFDGTYISLTDFSVRSV